MKYIFIVLLVIICTSIYCQTNHLETTSFKTDCYGSTYKYPFKKINCSCHQMNMQSSIIYDSTRALDEINDFFNADAYPWISPDGLRLYFIRGTNPNLFNTQLMLTERVNTNSYFNSPIIVPLGISNPTSCWFSNDELNVYICNGDSIYFADRITSSSPFNSPVPIQLTGFPPHTFVGGASLNLAQDILLLSLDTSTTYQPVIAEFSRTSPTSFSYTRTLFPPTGYETGVGQLSKDDLTYYFDARFNNGFSLLYQVSRTTVADSFNLSMLQLIQGINDTLKYNIEPSMSDNLDWLAFVRASTIHWESNDLYLSHNGITSSAFNQETKPQSVSLFPNPTIGQFAITLSSTNAEITVNDIFGKQLFKIQSEQLTTRLQLDNNGVYLVQVTTKQGVTTQKLIVNR
jgi:hypothetical protein